MSRDYFAGCELAPIGLVRPATVLVVEDKGSPCLVVWSAETLADVVARIAGES